MGAKIKKEVKLTTSKEEKLISRLTPAIPVMGLIVMATMGTYISSPLVKGNNKALIIFAAVALLGLLFAFSTYCWQLKADEKGVTVHTVFGDKTVFYDNIKKVEIHLVAGTFSSYSLKLKNDKDFVKVYPIMTNSIQLLERLKRLGIKVVEM